MARHPITFGYVLFYVLFSVDTWRIVLGIIIAFFLVPRIPATHIGPGGKAMLWVMVACIGWWITAYPGKLMANAVRRFFLHR